MRLYAVDPAYSLFIFIDHDNYQFNDKNGKTGKFF